MGTETRRRTLHQCPHWRGGAKTALAASAHNGRCPGRGTGMVWRATVLPREAPVYFPAAVEGGDFGDFESEISRLRLSTGVRFRMDIAWPRVAALVFLRRPRQGLDSGYAPRGSPRRDNTPGPHITCLTWSRDGGLGHLRCANRPTFMSLLAGTAMAASSAEAGDCGLVSFYPAVSRRTIDWCFTHTLGTPNVLAFRRERPHSTFVSIVLGSNGVAMAASRVLAITPDIASQGCV